ncbi:Response regulator PleD [Aquimixticola soesokkakensis]|uniref:diguanylate cyclase n=1 Tax=Aquimixticola soesokkakensis TaxID=1519096 RepID=A0A1Y5SCF6_9RHOB|nr:diguanylate cyclase [Aquimixticola soesokkakensis]SLN37460.1 Response regulator PleD [Aquimixticola soesokkakensis]
MPGRILIADDVATNRIVMKVKLSAAFYEVSQAINGHDTLAMARATIPDLIILDMTLGDMSAPEVCLQLKADPVTAAIPVIIATARSDTETKLTALQAGADEFLTKPLDEMTLLARVRNLLRSRATSDELARRDATARELGFAEMPTAFTRKGRIALVGRETDDALTWRAGLRGMISDTIEVIPHDRVLELAAEGQAADIYVISSDLPDPGAGLRLLSELRSRENTRFCATVIVHEMADRNSAIMALDLGANDLITRGFDPEEMAIRLRAQMKRKIETDRLRASVEDGYRLAIVDPLTGLYNRRYALPHLKKLARESEANYRPFALMLVDIDKFKVVNDTLGHAAGDDVLQQVAQRLQNGLRSMDLIARIGGEEFLVAMPATSLVDARRAAERLREVISSRPFDYGLRNGASGEGAIGQTHVTVSIGLVMGGDTGPQAPTLDELMSAADRALYASKAEGRNQVTLGCYAA